MKNSIKRILSIVIVAVLLFSTIPVSVAAADPTADRSEKNFFSVIYDVAETVVEKMRSAVNEIMKKTVENETGIKFNENSVTIDGKDYDLDSFIDFVRAFGIDDDVNKSKAINSYLEYFTDGVFDSLAGILKDSKDIITKDEYETENFYAGMSDFLTEASDDAVWSLGYSQKSIIPDDIFEKDYYLGGCGMYDEIDGVVGDVKVRVVALNDNSGRGTAVFAVVDVVGLYNKDVREIREILADFAEENNIVSFNVLTTHNHSSIDTQGLWTRTPETVIRNLFVNLVGIGEMKKGADQEYLNFVKDTTAQAIKEACGNMETGELYYASCHYPNEENFQYTGNNSKYSKTKRVCYDKDGNRYKINCDNRISRFRFVPHSGATPTMIVNLAIHPNVIGQWNQNGRIKISDESGNSVKIQVLSGDYIPYMEKVINEAGYNFLLVIGAVASEDVETTSYRKEQSNLLESIEDYGYELGIQTLSMTMNEEEVKKDETIMSLSDKYLSDRECYIHNENDEAVWIDYYWYEDKAYTTEEKLEPILNVKTEEIILEVENSLIEMMGKLGIANATILKDDDGKYYYVTELGYMEFGDTKIAMIPGEIVYDLVIGGVSCKAEYSFTNTDYPYPSLNEIAGDDDLLIFGLANDEIGYIVPENDFCNPKLYYYDEFDIEAIKFYMDYIWSYPNASFKDRLYESIDILTVFRFIGFVEAENHYLELLSFGEHIASDITLKFKELVDSVK